MLLKNRYELGNTIGSGGMSVTYSAYDKQSNKEVVVKVTNVEDTASRTKALRECDLLMNLNHRNIVSVYDSLAENNKVYMIMEKIEGITLREYISRYNTDFETSVHIMLTICSVLDYLHSQNPIVIYRDLTPDNVMINPSTKELKLIDFGIARLYKEQKHKDTEQLGTPGFAPPEQYGFDQTDGRSDIYSLGATMYYLISRKEPFTYPRVNKPLKDFIPDMAKNSSYRQLSDIIERCMKPKKVDRFTNCKELGNHLCSLLPKNEKISAPAQEADKSYCKEENIKLGLKPSKFTIDENICLLDRLINNKLILGGLLGFFVLMIIVGLLNL